MALATISSETTTPQTGPSVHPQETSEHYTQHHRYREHLILPVQAEYDATDQTYTAIDRRDYKTRSFDLMQCKTDAWLAVSNRTRHVIVLSHSCRLRWCPLCSKTRSRLIADGVTSWLKTHPRPKILTLTLKHSTESLDSQITRLYACFRELRRAKFMKTSIRGGIWFFQVKWIKETSQWHPHLHCLLDSEYIPHGILKQAWKRVTGDSEIVDIRVIYKAKTAAEYVARYAARPAMLSELPTSRRVECVDSLHNRRLLGKWGSANEIVFSRPERSDDGEFVPVARFSNMWRHVKEHALARVTVLGCCTNRRLPPEIDIGGNP
jgi:hypothetical protein